MSLFALPCLAFYFLLRLAFLLLRLALLLVRLRLLLLFCRLALLSVHLALLLRRLALLLLRLALLLLRLAFAATFALVWLRLALIVFRLALRSFLFVLCLDSVFALPRFCLYFSSAWPSSLLVLGLAPAIWLDFALLPSPVALLLVLLALLSVRLARDGGSVFQGRRGRY